MPDPAWRTGGRGGGKRRDKEGSGQGLEMGFFLMKSALRCQKM